MAGDVRMIRPERLLADDDSAPVERLGFGGAAGVLVEPGKVIEPDGDVRVIRPERLLIPNPADQCAGELGGVTAGHQAKWVAALITSGMSARVRQRSLSAASRSLSV